MTMKISVRQVCFIMLAYTAVSKLIMYPTVLSTVTGRDLLFSALIDFAIQGLIVWTVSFAMSRTDKTFFELLEATFGNICARIIFALFALFFLVCTVIPLIEQEEYVHAIFYDSLSPLIVFVPFFFFSVYAASKGFENMGRSADICFPIFAISMVLILLMALPEVKWDNFLPVLKNSSRAVLTGSFTTYFRFFEPSWLLMFMGHFKYKKGDAAKITLSYIGGALVVILFLAVFYGLYGAVSPTRLYAISKVSLFFPAIDMIGRIDLVTLYALEVVMLFALVINVQFAVYCISKCTGYSNTVVISLAVNAVLFILILALDSEFSAVHELWSNWMWIVFVIFANIVPPLVWTLKRREK